MIKTEPSFSIMKLAEEKHLVSWFDLSKIFWNNRNEVVLW